jgi:hypothetical protein
MTDERTYIKVHDGIEDHPKIAALSDKGFRVLVTTWGWCSKHRTDGRVPIRVWKKRGTVKVRAELVAAGLVELCGDFALMHDYLAHQRSAQQIADDISEKKRGGRLGNHRRWHTDRGVYDEGCEFCQESGPPEEPPPPSHDRSVTDRSTDPLSDNDFGNESNIRNANDVRLHVKTLTKNTSDLTVQNAPASANSHRIPIGHRSRSDRLSSPDTDTDKGSDGDPRSSLHVSDARERGISGPNSTAAARLVASVIGRHVPSAVRTGLAIEVVKLWPEASPDELAEALRRWDARTGIGPALLPGLLADIRKEARGATTRASPGQFPKSATDQFAEQFLAAGRTPGPPELRALPGGATA